MLKNKRALLIVSAVVFIVVIFSIKTRSSFQNTPKETEGLTYNSTVLETLVNKDSDKDGIVDWEEGLWGTDPYNKDSNADGISDDKEIAKLKIELKKNTDDLVAEEPQGGESSSQTDKFSQELLTTMAALNQTGEIDPATIEKLGTTLADQIENSPQKKVFGVADIKIVKDDSVAAIQKYNGALDSITKKYPLNNSAMDILEEFAADKDNVSSAALAQLDPIVEQATKSINEILQVGVPQSLVSLHLEFINGLEKVAENLRDIGLYDTDAILSLAAISQYEENATALGDAIINLSETINQKTSS